jgi:hypothetical protein
LDVDANSEGTASQCPDEAHQLREEQLDTQQTSMVANSNMGGSALQAEWDLEAARTSPICPVKSCAAGVEAECEHVQQALQINHEGHIDYVMDGKFAAIDICCMCIHIPIPLTSALDQSLYQRLQGICGTRDSPKTDLCSKITDHSLWSIHMKIS